MRSYTGGAAHHSPQPRQGRGSRPVRRHSSHGLGLRHARQPARPWGGVAGVPGASAARRALRRRVRRYRLQRRGQASAAARDCHRATARHAERYHTEALSGRPGSPARSDHGGCPDRRAGRKLRKRIAASRSHLFVFVTNRSVPYTNNVSERNLRPSVIFRKVTNGFRCEWGAETYAAFRSVVSTAKANQTAVLRAIRAALITQPMSIPG